MMNIEVVENKIFAGVVSDEIVASINDAISDHGECKIALAGGKTPSVVYRAIARPPRVGEVDWAKVKIFWGDERFVPQTDVQSNFNMAQEAFLSFLAKISPKYFAVDTSLASASESAKAYEQVLRREFAANEGQMPIFDLVLLGVGEDGHTASIFPQAEILKGDWQHSAEICIASRCPYDDTDRVSLSPAAIINARRIIYIVRGEGKRSVLNKVINGEANILDLPAQLYRECQGKVTFFVDSAAAESLS